MEQLISIITVCRNEEKTIECTIQSVLEQTYSKIEYIVMDGQSSDDTMRIVEGYKEVFQKKGIPYLFFSEKDEGIYFAMNKAITYCTGSWILFLNANDKLYSKDTLMKVFKNPYDINIGCIYGNTWNEKSGIRYFKKAFDMRVIYYKAPFIHQALFVRTEIMKRYGFDTVYSVSADYDLFVRLYLDGVLFQKIDVDISIFNLDGISQKNRYEVDSEWRQIQAKYNIANKYIVRKKLRRLILKMKQSKILYMSYIFYKKYMGKKQYLL